MKPSQSFLCLISCACIFVSCSNRVYEETARGIVVKVQNPSPAVKAGCQSPRLVRLQIAGEKIVHVSATADKKFADRQSLIIIPQTKDVPYTTTQSGDTITLSTSAIKAHVLASTGEVWFTDLHGKTIVHEKYGGGKEFKPYSCTQTHADGKAEQYTGWSIRQVFESPDDEAFYGLGQHQADEWNYKGRNEELFQYNTKVAIPFVVSSRNYGILLDSYSLCRFGNPDDYSQLHRIFLLTDKNGRPGALTGTYSAPGESTLIRREDSIYFENLKSAKNLPRYKLDNATVLYEGTIEPKETGEYRFSHYYSGYQRIFIDGKDVYDEDVAGTGDASQTIWRTAWNPNARKFSVYLEKGRRYQFRLEWQPDGGEAYCGLRAYAPVPREDQQRLSLWSEMSQQFDYYLMAGDNTDEVISGYRTLTGKAPVMPDWLLGYWQSRERYKTQREILDALEGFRSRHLPIDNIVMDWNYWTPDSWGSFEFEPTRFADPAGMIDTIHQNHAKIMISCWPKYYLTVGNYKELLDRKYIYMQSVRDSLYDWLGYRYAFYDAYAPEARRIFWRQLYGRLGTIGMDAWWMDASEPNVRDCTDLPYRKLLCGPTFYGSSDEYFNAYSIPNAEAIYDGQRAYETAVEKQHIASSDSKALQSATDWNPLGYDNHFSPNNKRVFLLTRNGFASEQRYSTATWSGDIGTRWEDLKAQITAGLNFSISGIPFWSQDIGGFSVERRYSAAQSRYDATGEENEDLKDWRELNTRWHQFGMWVPMYRSHGQYPYREPWNIAPEGHPAYEAIKSCLQLRYRLMPYLYSLTARVHFNDYTMMRPLVMDFGQDDKVLDIGYQYMFGPAFMVNPVYTYKARSREVYFPLQSVDGQLTKCAWYDFFTGALASEGGESKPVSAPYDHIPVYVRGGSIIPFGPAIEYTQQKKADDIRLYIYEGADGQFTLYEDEGTNYGYEAGRYANIPIAYDDAARTLTIGTREGEFPGMLRSRTFIIIFCTKDNPQAYNPEAQGQQVLYSGSEIQVNLGGK